MNKSFLDYLNEVDKKVEKKPIKESKNNSKVLELNIEISSPEGAKLVIEKLQDWVNKNFKEEAKETKKQYRIPSKKVNKSPIVETRSHAIDILDGLPDAVPEEILNKSNGINKQGNQQLNLDTVSGHASALL
ncbi:MAG: hypothetical protein ACOC22_03375 [bacterium]